ncbi:MAG: hypothetical protein ABDH32_01635 [Candidatus Caldarchaeales archaeon]
MSLPQNFVENVLRYKKAYLDFRNKDEGLRFEEERRRHEAEVKKILSREGLEKFDKSSLLILANNLYAFTRWTKKEYLVDYWIEGAGGIGRLKHYLGELLYSDRDLAARFDEFRKNIKGIGIAMMTEMLSYFNPREYCIWNRRVKEALVKLGLTQIDKFRVNKLTGEEYVSIIDILKELVMLLKDPERLTDPDLLDVDYFLYYVLELVEEDEKYAGEEVFDHDEVVDMLLRIGRGLGFDAFKEVPLTYGAKVDLVWSAKIGNLGELRYVFEVQIKGSIDGMILNLVRASQDPTVQKVVAVASEEELEKIKREVSTLKMLSDKLVYWNIREVLRVNELIEKLMDIMQRLGLTKL